MAFRWSEDDGELNVDHTQWNHPPSQPPQPIYYPALAFQPDPALQALHAQPHTSFMPSAFNDALTTGRKTRQAPPERHTRPLPNLRFLKTATADSLARSIEELSSLQQASSWFEAAHKTMKERMELAKSIQESCQRILGIMEILKTLRKSEKERNGAVKWLEGEMKELGVGQEVASIGQEAGECDNKTEVQEVGKDDNNETWDYATLVRLAEENINDLRVLRAKWQAGGKNLEDISGLRQNEGIRFGKKQPDSTRLNRKQRPGGTA